MNTILFVLLLISRVSYSQNDSLAIQQDTLIIKVNFLYGSRPLSNSERKEERYFGGKHGGHVSIEIDSIDYGFGSEGRFHIFARRNNLHSSYIYKKTEGRPAYKIGRKFATFYIPVSYQQYEQAKEILNSYCQKTPYDYAFFGMRCASSAHQVLGQLGILEKKNNFKCIVSSFYPKKLRRKMFRLAKEKQYKYYLQKGRKTRDWEKD
jgi:hypothetical protein